MLVNKVLLITLLLVLSGCSSMPNYTEVRQGVKTVSYVQYGNEPVRYGLGVVDGKSFWGKGDGGSSVQPGLLFAVALDTLEDSAEAEANRIAPIMIKSMLGEYNPVDEMANKVMPVMAKSWGLPFERKSVIYFPSVSPLEDDDGYYLGEDLKTDLIITYSVDNVELDEKDSIGGFFEAMVTVGFNDKSVAPTIMASVNVYKPEAISGRHKRIWWTSCLVHSLHSNSTVKFNTLKEDPEKGRVMMQDSLALFVENCQRVMSK